MQIKEALAFGKTQLKPYHPDCYIIDCKVLLMHAGNFSLEDITFNQKKSLDDQVKKDFKNYLKRRQNCEPIAYITGKKEFYSLNFNVNYDTLIPRPDSEILVTNAINLIKNHKNPKILDLGCGSGCLILSILKNISGATGMAVDINPNSLIIAKQNAQNLNLDNKITFLESNWLDNVNKTHKFDLIISNPPYIKNDEINKLSLDIKNFEPKIALKGGTDGLDCYKQIAQNAPLYLNENAKIIVEIGQNQEQEITKIFQDNCFELISEKKDLNKIKRCLIFSL